MILTKRHHDAHAVVHNRLAGEYRLVKTHAATGDVTQDTGWFDNLILTSGFNSWVANENNLGTCFIGTGTSAPSAGQTSLQAQAASSSTVVDGLGDDPPYDGRPYSSWMRAWRFNTGALNGTYTEVGVGQSGSNLFSRALIVDGSGNPASLSVGPTERLDIYYRVRRYVPLGLSSSGSVSLLGATRNYTVRAMNLQGSPWRINHEGISTGALAGGATITSAATQWSGVPTARWSFDALSASRSGSTVTITGTRGLGAATGPFRSLWLASGWGAANGAVIEMAFDADITNFTADHTLTLSLSFGYAPT